MQRRAAGKEQDIGDYCRIIAFIGGGTTGEKEEKETSKCLEILDTLDIYLNKTFVSSNPTVSIIQKDPKTIK